MAREIDDQRGEIGRQQTAGGAQRQDQTRQDSDRGYGAREGQRESGRDDDPDRGHRGPSSGSDEPRPNRGDKARAERQAGQENHDDRGVSGKPGAFYESQNMTPNSGGLPNQYSGMGGSRTDEFHADKASSGVEGWKEVGENDGERIGSEDQRPGEATPRTGASTG